ncbi:MAG TPA: hypothetical protein VLY83_00570 [Methanoregula sp.]|nr:hypothetical protein [Methanoregula sp.]
MTPPEKDPEQEKKIHNLEQELNDLRQGLAVVTDYYRDLEGISRKQEATAAIDEGIAKPLIDDDLEFEGIWRFHEEDLVADPSASVPCSEMYDSFVRYCTGSGRKVIEREAFEFVFSRMENPQPTLDRGVWTGYRLRRTYR